MIRLVVTGGQSGADQAGWRAAVATGFPCSGWMPKGFLTEDGPRPEFAGLYGAKEHPRSGYRFPRLANVTMTAKSGGPNNGYAIVFDATPGEGVSRETQGLHNDQGKLRARGLPCPDIALIKLIRQDDTFVFANRMHSPDVMAAWINYLEVRALLVAGNRESSSPGIGAWVEEYLREMFRIRKDEMADQFGFWSV